MLVRDIAHVGMPVKGQGVVLAETKELDWSLNHLAQPAVWPAAALCLEGRQQFGIALIALGCIKHGSQEALRSPLRSCGMQI